MLLQAFAVQELASSVSADNAATRLAVLPMPAPALCGVLAAMQWATAQAQGSAQGSTPWR